jgi:single-strand DNA-binding protein
MINKAILLGNLGADPEVRYAPSGTAIVNFTVATTETYKDKKETSWHKVKAFGKLAEICEKYLHKGKQVYIEGRIQYGSYEDRQGIKRYTTDIIASTMQMLGSKNDTSGRMNERPPIEEPLSIPDEQIPF